MGKGLGHIDKGLKVVPKLYIIVNSCTGTEYCLKIYFDSILAKDIVLQTLQNYQMQWSKAKSRFMKFL